MNCEHVRELLSPHLDGTLVDRDREAVLAHLEVCSPCREHFEGLVAVVSLIRGIPSVRAPDRFRDGVVGGLPSRGNGSGGLLRLFPAAAAAVLLVGMGFLGALHFLPDAGGPPVEVGLVAGDADAEERPFAEGTSSQNPADRGLASSSAPAHTSPPAVLPDAAPGGVGIGGGAGGAFPLSAEEDGAMAGTRDGFRGERVLSYVVSGGQPDATAGVILAELQNRRSRYTVDALRESPAVDGAPVVRERVVSDEEGEPARLVLYLTADEVRYILTLLARRNGDTRVSGRRSEVERSGDARPDGTSPRPPVAAGKPDGGESREPGGVSAPRSTEASDTDKEKPGEERGAGDDGVGEPPERFRVELRFDR